MGFVKQLLQITRGDTEITTESGFDFNGHFEMDEICGTLSFGLPYANVESAEGEIIDFKDLKRYDKVKLFYKEFDEDPGNVITTDLRMIFYGYINTTKLSKSKSSYNYKIECLGILGIGNERGVDPFNENFTGITSINLLLQSAGLQSGTNIIGGELIPSSDVVSALSDGAQNMIIHWDGGKLLKNVLEQIRERYGIRVHYRGDGKCYVFDPFAFFNTQVVVWEFKLGDNIVEIDYGDLTTKINTVVVKGGYPGKDPNGEFVVVVVDPTSLQLSADATDGVIRRDNYSQYVTIRRDLLDPSEAETVAKNLLLQFIRNQVLTIKVPFNPEFKVTDFVSITDGEKYENTFFMIKSYDFMITKNDVICTLQCVSSILAQLPDSFILNPLAINDIRVLENAKDITDAIGWNAINV